LKLDEEQSGIRVISDCGSCSQRRCTFRRDGLVLPGAAWNGEKLFRIAQFARSGATFVTEEASSMH
jgi:hypothetical protein